MSVVAAAGAATMSPPSSVSSSLALRKRRNGRRLVIWLMGLFLCIVYLMWSENLDSRYFGDNDATTLVKTKKGFEGGIYGPFPTEEEDDEVLDAMPYLDHNKKNPLKFDRFEVGLKKMKYGRENNYGFKSMKRHNHDTQKMIKQQKQLMRRQQEDRDKITAAFAATAAAAASTYANNNDDDGIPMAAGGFIMHSADTLLCRESVIDYVINATDLKDECDGLTKAYTQTCAADDVPLATRRLDDCDAPKKFNGVRYWKHRLMHWSRSLEYALWGNNAVTRHGRALEEEDGSDLDLESEFPLDEISSGDVENTEEVNSGDDDDSSSSSSSSSSLWTPVESIKELSKMDMIGAVRRKIIRVDDPPQTGKTAEETKNNKNNDNNEKETPPSTEQTDSNANTNTNAVPPPAKKPLANLALPINSKHVSDKALTETLMLEQDNKQLMKAVANHTNPTEAQADAAASVKAIADTTDAISNLLNDPTAVEARQCCSSILRDFKQRCSTDEEDELSDRRLLVGVLVIAICGLVKSLVRYFQIRWLPEAGGCILVGVAAGYILTFYPHHDISFDGKWFLRIMVPPIVFEAALSIDKRSFSRHIVPILFYAVFGTLIATGVTAFVVSKLSEHLPCETIPYPEGLAFGALISSIDPIAVLSVLSNMGMTDQDTIYVVIFGESLLNDGVAIVLFETLVHFLDENMDVDRHAITAAAIHFLVVFIGSLLIGVGSGMCCTLYYWIMVGCQTPLVEVLMFLCWALLPYYVCDGIDWSGIVAVVAVGFIMDMYVVGTEKPMDLEDYETDSDYGEDAVDKVRAPRRGTKVRRPIFSKEGLLSKEARTHIAFVTEIIATMMETAIFAYLGLFLFSTRYHWNPNHVFIAILGCCLSRAIMIPSLSLTANWITKNNQSGAICRQFENPQLSHHPSETQPNHGVVIDSKMQLVLWFAGLRGAMSFALVEHLPQYDAVSGEGTRLKSELKAMTSACIIFTVFVLGGGTYYMMEALGLAPKSPSDNIPGREMELVGLLSITEDEETRTEEYDAERTTPLDDPKTIVRKSSNDSLRRPGKPVRRPRNRSKEHR